MLKYFIYKICGAKFEINLTKNEDVMTNSQSQPKTTKIMFFTPKIRSHSISLAYNVKKGIRCNYIRKMKSLVPVLIQKS